MASLPWSPWPPSNRTETLSPAQIERILQMHKESKQNAVIYVLVVLVLYFVALAILVGRYLQNERDVDALVCIGQALERCVDTCRRSGSAGLSPASAAANGAAAAKQDAVVPPPLGGGLQGGGPRKLSLRLPGRAPIPTLNLPKVRRPPQSDSSSDSSSSSSPPAQPLRPGLGASLGPGCSASSSEGADSQVEAEARSVDCPLDTLSVYPNDCHPGGRSSPAVVSIMVCDLEDTKV